MGASVQGPDARAMHEYLGAMYALAGSYRKLPEVLALVSEATNADAVYLGLDLGHGYLRERYVSPRLNPRAYQDELEQFGDWSHKAPRLIAAAQGSELSAPEAEDEEPNAPRRHARHLPVGLQGRRTAPRSALALMRLPERGDFSEREHAVLSALMPHVIQVLRLTFEQERAREIQMLLSETSAQLGHGLMLLDAFGSILHLNTHARELAARARLIQAGHLAPVAEAERERVDAALRASGDSTNASSLMLGKDPALMLTLYPAASLAAPDAFRHSTVRVVATLKAVEPPISGLNHHAMGHFNLTRAEQRLCEALVAGRGLKECSENWGVAYNTLRVQLQSIFMKTATHRQAELVSLLARYRRDQK